LAALVAAGSAALLFAGVPIVILPTIFPMYVATMIVVNLVLVILLLVKGASDENQGTIRLGVTYLFVCLMNLLHGLSFPGGVMPTPLIGTSQTAAWVWLSWHVGFGLAMLQYTRLAGRHGTGRVSVLKSVLVTLTVSSGIAVIATSCTHILPPLLRGGAFIYTFPSNVPWSAAAVATLAGLTSLICRRPRTPEHLWLIVAMAASCLDVCLTMLGCARYTVGWYVGMGSSLFASLSVLISLIYDITCVYTKISASNSALHSLTRLDGLTGVANRRCFDEILLDEFERARRLNVPLALLLLDIDDFKSYNDSYGHPAGDECLRRVSGAVKNAFWRAGDLVARYGGEEFAVVLPSVDLAGARLIADRVCLAVSALDIEHPASSHRVVTVSVGAAAFIPCRGDETHADLLKAADIALYAAKKSGKNRACTSLSGDQLAVTAAAIG
jgi:diguanylate cyclase (GGDEF)-like protein